MTSLSFSSRGSAPGTFVYEDTAGVNTAQLTSFNTVYIPVEVDESVNSVVFPFNTPVAINSYQEYLDLLNNRVPVDRWQFLSLQCVEAIFKNAGSGDVRVVRLTPPTSVTEISINPSANKLGFNSDVSQLEAGDVVYLQLSFNGIQLGESDSLGNYRGVPVTIPQTYQIGQTGSNQLISLAMTQAISDAIESDPEVNSAIYVREVGTTAGSEVTSVKVASRVYGGEISVVNSSVVFDGGFVLASNGYGISTVVRGNDLDYLDYAQALQTAFDGGDIPKGYLICPVGFAKFKQSERVMLGQLMETVAAEDDKKWVALVDSGSFTLSSIEEYSGLQEHQASDGFVTGGEYLINNNFVKWLGAEYAPSSATYVPSDDTLSANGHVQGDRVSLADDKEYYVLSAANATDVFTLNKEWTLPSGTEVELSELTGATLPGGLQSQKYYVISTDIDGGLANDKEVRLALSYSDAINGIAVVISTDGTANGGGNVFLLKSARVAWEFPQEIGGVRSNLVEVTNPVGANFNLHNAPASLQKPTNTLFLKAVYRRINDPAVAGVSDDSGDILFTVDGHGLSNKDIVTFSTAITTGTGATDLVSVGTPYLVKKEGVNTFKLASSEANFNVGLYLGYAAPDAASDVDFYSNLKVATSAGQFFPLSSINLIKGRKYQVDVTGVNTSLRDEDGVAVAGGLRIQQYAISNPAVGAFSFSHLEDGNAAPLSQASPLLGSTNFLCVPKGLADTDTYLHLVTFDGTSTYALTGEDIRAVYVEPTSPVPESLWNVKTISSFQLLDEGLRVEDAEIVESGVDNHSRILQDGKRYSTTRGFLAFYAPYILNDAGNWIPPTPYVVGVALRRYRDEGGFQSPPAGTKFPLIGARDIQVAISTAQQNLSNPEGINAVRKLPNYGDQIFIWGARTRVNTANADQALYQFVNTRVIMNVLFGTLKTAFDNVIFSTGESPTVVFNEIRSLANSALYNFYVDGYLFGNTPTEAYEVILDERNNPRENLENGLINMKVFAVPATITERVEIDLFRVAVGNVSEAVSQRGF